MSRVGKTILEDRHASVRIKSYIVGFVLSIATTLLAYFIVKNSLWQNDVMVYAILLIASVQFIVQMYFFLHLGRGSRLKSAAFAFAVIVILIVVVGTIWVMNNLDYNMMHMTPGEMEHYMDVNQGL